MLLLEIFLETAVYKNHRASLTLALQLDSVVVVSGESVFSLTSEGPKKTILRSRGGYFSDAAVRCFFPHWRRKVDEPPKLVNVVISALVVVFTSVDTYSAQTNGLDIFGVDVK